MLAIGISSARPTRDTNNGKVEGVLRCKSFNTRCIIYSVNNGAGRPVWGSMVAAVRRVEVFPEELDGGPGKGCQGPRRLCFCSQAAEKSAERQCVSPILRLA